MGWREQVRHGGVLTLVSGLYKSLRTIRGIPGTLGLRLYSLSVTIRANDGRQGLRGSATDTTIVIQEGNSKNPKSSFAKEDDIAAGLAVSGQITFGPISPEATDGTGYTLAELLATSAAATNLVFYTVTGPLYPNGQLHQRTSVRTDSALHWTVTLKPTAPVV